MNSNVTVGYLKESAKAALLHCEDVYKIAISREQQNEQWFINWLDKLNKIATDQLLDIRTVYKEVDD